MATTAVGHSETQQLRASLDDADRRQRRAIATLRLGRRMSGDVRGRRSAIQGSHVLVALAGILGALLTLTAIRNAQRTVAVAAMRHDLPVGAVVRASDTKLVQIGADNAVLDTLFRDDQQQSLVGQVVIAPVRSGDIVRRSDLRRAATSDSQRAMSFAVDAADAVGGAIVVGDRVDVVGVTRTGTKSGYVVTDAAIVSVTNPQSSGPLRSADRKVVITMNVTPEAALRIVAAQAAGKVVVVKATGAVPQRSVVPFTVRSEG